MTTSADLRKGYEVYNVTVAVVQNVAARDEAEAIDQVSAALTRAGFDVFDDPTTQNAFEAEEGTEVSDSFDPCAPRGLAP